MSQEQEPKKSFDDKKIAAEVDIIDAEKGGGGGLTYLPRDKEERKKIAKKAIRKLDSVILPLTALLYLAAYLDRSNIGNAKLQGLYTELLASSDNKYSVVLLSFYVTYMVFSIPGTLLGKAMSPSVTIALGCLIWSISASSFAGTQNYAGAIVCRLFLGVGEAIFGQTIALYYSYWYKRDEIAKRLALFIGAGVTSGAFGGLIAYGVSHIKSNISTWRILFLVDGLPSLLLGVICLFALPSRPDKSKFLNEQQSQVVIDRLNEDSLAEADNGIDWKGVKRALTDWKPYMIVLIYSGMNITLSSLGGFLPTIIKTLGYTNANAQLFTVPPYATALVVMVILNTMSDRMKSRGIFIAIVFIISAVGWVILLAVEKNQHARYFACFCITIGGYAAIPLLMSWQANNSGSQSQRACALGMLNSLGNYTSIASAFMFPEKDSPKFITGFATNLAFTIMAIVVSLGMSFYYRRENKRRDMVEGGPPPEGTILNVTEMHDLAPGFRYIP